MNKNVQHWDISTFSIAATVEETNVLQALANGIVRPGCWETPLRGFKDDGQTSATEESCGVTAIS